MPDGGVWFTVAIFLAGILAGAAPMLVRGDFLGKKAAEETEARLKNMLTKIEDELAKDITEAEKRANERMDREMRIIGHELSEIKKAQAEGFKEVKAAIVRLEGRTP